MGFIVCMFIMVSLMQLTTVKKELAKIDKSSADKSPLQEADKVDCSSKDVFGPIDCCEKPNLVEAEVKKISSAFRGLTLDQTYLSQCKNTERILKELKLVKDGGIDELEIAKFIDTIVEEDVWKTAFKAMVKDCHTSIKAKLPELIKKMEAEPFNVKKDQCNVEYGSIAFCLFTQGFEKCPASKWSEVKECADQKQWMIECGKKFDSFKEFFIPI